MRLLGFAILLAPAFALAQPAEPPPAGPPPPPPAGPPAPPDAGPPPGVAPGAMQPVQPMPMPVPAAASGPWATHTGVVFEANLGIGFAHASSDGGSADSDAALAGADLGIGGWLSPQLALTARIAGVDVKNGDVPSNGTLVHAFFGPSVQYWINPQMWVGGGAGLSIYRLVGSDCASSGTGGGVDPCGISGFGLDLRAGYSFPTTTKNQFNVSFEANPGFYSENGASATITGLALLVGYQYL